MYFPEDLFNQHNQYNIMAANVPGHEKSQGISSCEIDLVHM